jgi:hypothetical protein
MMAHLLWNIDIEQYKAASKQASKQAKVVVLWIHRIPRSFTWLVLDNLTLAIGV